MLSILGAVAVILLKIVGWMIRNRFPEEVESRFTNEVQIQGHWEDMRRAMLKQERLETTLLTNGVL